MLAQLEVAYHDVAVACFKSVAKFLNGVLVDESTSCLTLCVDSTGHVAEALAHVEAEAIDVAVCSADGSFYTIETILQAAIDGVEAIAQAVGNTTELSIDVLSVEALEQVGTS